MIPQRCCPLPTRSRPSRGWSKIASALPEDTPSPPPRPVAPWGPGRFHAPQRAARAARRLAVASGSRLISLPRWPSLSLSPTIGSVRATRPLLGVCAVSNACFACTNQVAAGVLSKRALLGQLRIGLSRRCVLGDALVLVISPYLPLPPACWATPWCLPISPLISHGVIFSDALGLAPASRLHLRHCPPLPPPPPSPPPPSPA